MLVYKLHVKGCFWTGNFLTTGSIWNWVCCSLKDYYLKHYTEEWMQRPLLVDWENLELHNQPSGKVCRSETYLKISVIWRVCWLIKWKWIYSIQKPDFSPTSPQKHTRNMVGRTRRSSDQPEGSLCWFVHSWTQARGTELPHCSFMNRRIGSCDVVRNADVLIICLPFSFPAEWKECSLTNIFSDVEKGS